MSGIRLPDCSRLAVNWKNGNDITIFWHDVIFKFFWRCFVSLVKFSYWPEFHVNVITGFGLMTISFYKGLTRNPEIGNTPVSVLSNNWKLGRARNAKFGTKVSNKMVLNAAKCQGYSFYRVGVIKVKPIGGGGLGVKFPLPPSRLGLTSIIDFQIFLQLAQPKIISEQLHVP